MKIGILEAILGIVGLISLASLGAILLFIAAPPIGSGKILEPVLFSLSTFFFLASALTFGGLRARRKFITLKNRRAILTISLREAVLLSALVVSYLWLAHFNIFKIWTTLPLAAAVIGLEYYFLTRPRHGQS